MAAFKGQAAYSVDAKGRVAIPAKMRAVLNPEAKNAFTITRGFEKCVFLYPLDHWGEMEGEMRGLNAYNRESRNFLRTILMWADEVALDGQGRITIARPLMEFAGISPGGSALIIGALDHIEIWDPQTFEDYVTEHVDEYEALAERVMGTGNE
jgi:MraZ protein